MSLTFRHFRRCSMAGLLAAVSALPVQADGWQDAVMDALVEQGYEIAMIHRTLLGRVRIIAESDAIRREIVINPHSGEVLRDYSSLLGPSATNFASRNPDRLDGDGAALAISAIEAVEDPVAPQTSDAGD